MSEETETEEDDAPKASKLPLIIGAVLALVGAGGGYFAVGAGLIPGIGGSSAAADHGDAHAEADAHGDGHAASDDGHGDSHAADSHAAADSHGAGHGSSHSAAAVGGFLPIDPIIVALPREARHTHLRFSAQLEIDPKYGSEIAEMKPRIIDVMNTYLRSISVEDFEDPHALSRMRAHLLARMQIVAGAGKVRDVLIMEFVLT